MSKIVLIGNGFMACAIAKGLADGGEREVAFVNALHPENAKCKAKELNIKFDVPEAIADAETVILAFKPQSLAAAAPTYAPFVGAGQTLISILAGVDIATLRALFPKAGSIVRAMPNLALSVGLGAVGYAAEESAAETDIRRTEAVFAAVGILRRVEEKQIAAVTALSGSGPAYFYLLAEQMTKAAEQMGLDAELAADLAKQTMLGAAGLWQNDTASAAELRARITSKKGTTDAAVRQMQNDGFDMAVANGMAACAARSDELQAEIANQLKED